ncbi:MAG: hypothetical protein ABIO67_04460 [Mycobacteriales bacterium]
MSRRSVPSVTALEQHPNLAEILGVLAQLPHVRDEDLARLADHWHDNAAVRAARAAALSPDSPLVLEVLAAFDAVGALFADDVRGEAAYVTVRTDIATTALHAIRDAIAAAYAQPVLTNIGHLALMQPWRTVYPTLTVTEPDLGPRAEAVKALLALLPQLSTRCHDAQAHELFDLLADHAFVGESDRAVASQTAFDAAVLTSRRRIWALVRRTGTESLGRPCPSCRTVADDDLDSRRVLTLCLDAACALLVADALPDATTSLLSDAVMSLIPLQRQRP